MDLVKIAQIYVGLIRADNEIPDSEYHAQDEVSALRAKYHQMLMDKLSEEGIEFADRFDAMNKAFELVNKSKILIV